jgi:hypothetical protein
MKNRQLLGLPALNTLPEGSQAWRLQRTETAKDCVRAEKARGCQEQRDCRKTRGCGELRNCRR